MDNLTIATKLRKGLEHTTDNHAQYKVEERASIAYDGQTEEWKEATAVTVTYGKKFFKFSVDPQEEFSDEIAHAYVRNAVHQLEGS